MKSHLHWIDFVSTNSNASAGHREESMWCLLVRPSYWIMLVEGSQTLHPVAVFGFWVSGQVVCPLLITIVTWCTINTLTPLLPHQPFLYLFLFCYFFLCVFLMSFYTFYCTYLLVKAYSGGEESSNRAVQSVVLKAGRKF